jgi:MFS family permease
MIQSNKISSFRPLFSVPVIVAALGYFVDIYDLLLFGIVRIPSLQSMGLSDSEISLKGAYILNWQMIGLLLGGILWGVLGDKKGRLSVLFGSILTYSIANIGCGFVNSPETYMILRFIAGIGLAGELGAGITLVSEVLPKQLRAIGTSLVAGIGLLGAVFAYFTVEIFEWRTAYFIGGGMGLSLLLLRLGVFESGVFENTKHQSSIQKGNFFSLFTNRKRFLKYLKCIGLGVPTWFVIGIIATFGNEIGKALSIATPIKPGLAIMWCYIGLSLGDFSSGFVSHYLQSRKKTVLYFILYTFFVITAMLYSGIEQEKYFYGLIFFAGIGIGYWAMFVTIAAEQFGTNLRATAATTVPNMVRGTVVLMTISFNALKNDFSIIFSVSIIGIFCFWAGIYSALNISETHDIDMDFIED